MIHCTCVNDTSMFVSFLKYARDVAFRDRLFNLKGGGLWFFVSFRIYFSDNTRVRIFIFFVAQSAKIFSRI